MNHPPIKHTLAICNTEVVTRALYDDLLRQIATCNALMDSYDVPRMSGDFITRIEATLLLMKYSGVKWEPSENEGPEQEYSDTIASFEAGTGRV